MRLPKEVGDQRRSKAPTWDFGQKNKDFAGIGIGGGVAIPVNAVIDSHISTIKFGVNYRFS